ncbi:hypothetical protein Mal65_44850 [Crateriforma conspicua]|nr:hypothetical protein Mal65_44850 [Crateriforma conspicua]
MGGASLAATRWSGKLCRFDCDAETSTADDARRLWPEESDAEGRGNANVVAAQTATPNRKRFPIRRLEVQNTGRSWVSGVVGSA